jgi:hypothetical protein
MKTLLTVLAVAIFAGSGVAITIDGDISDWAAGDIYTDASGDGPAEFQIENWGFFYQSTTASDPGYLYAFIEASRPWSDYMSGTNDAWPGLWIDVDHYNGPVTQEWGRWRAGWQGAGPEYAQVFKSPSAAHINTGWVGSEWSGGNGPGDHRGIDITAELGINTGHWGEGWNYWGWDDCIGIQNDPIQNSSWAVAGNYLEMQVDISDIVSVVKGEPDFATGGQVVNGLWKVAARGEANVAGGGTFGVDVTAPVHVRIIGDVDDDGDVDIDDFSDMAVNFNASGLTAPGSDSPQGYKATSWEQGDLDMDSDVDLDDFAFLAVTFGKDMDSLAPGSAGAVPEPMTLALLGLGGLLLRRRR